MGFLSKGKIFIVQFLLLVFLSLCLFIYYKQTRDLIHQQKSLIYYVNISEKQRVLLQRIVFLSQLISANLVLGRDNHGHFIELRSLLNELSSIHSTLAHFVITQITQIAPSTLNDVYFGTANLSYNMENFLDLANQLLFVFHPQDALLLNQELLNYIEGKDGLLATSELATLSQQIYSQNVLMKMEKNLDYLLIAIIVLFGLNCSLFALKQEGLA